MSPRRRLNLSRNASRDDVRSSRNGFEELMFGLQIFSRDDVRPSGTVSRFDVRPSGNVSGADVRSSGNIPEI